MKNLLKPRVIIFFISLVFTSVVFFREISSFNVLTLIQYISLFFILYSLIYLAYYDFKNMEVHNGLSFVLMVSLLIINIVLYKGFKIEEEVLLFGYYFFSPLSNLLAALILGLISQAIVVISKENALGQGDVRIVIITGLIIGQGNILLWFYITILSSLFYALIIAREKKSFKNIKIPFVPFMILGIGILLILG